MSPEQIAGGLLETFDQGARADFARWLGKHPPATKWLVTADFALRDKSRPKDCFAFTLIPHLTSISGLMNDASSAMPRDLKDSRTLTAKGAAWLSDDRAFHILVSVDRSRVFFSAEGMTEREAATDSLRKTLQTCIDFERGDEMIRRVKDALEKSKAKNFNVGLMTDLILLSVLLPFITLILTRERKPDVISWLCDRDRMSSWCDGLLWYLCLNSLHGLADAWSIELGPDPLIGLPDFSSGKEIQWFDPLIRSPDWLAGVISAWDTEQNQVPIGNDKYLRALEDVIATASNIVILKLRLDAEGCQAARLRVTRNPGTE